MKKIILYINLILISCYAQNILADSLKQAVEIAAHGSKFQAERLKVAAENLANENSTGVSPGANAYRRKIIFPQNTYDKKLATHVLITKKIDTDNSDFIMKYEPHHPAANVDGLVKYPNISREIERADASEAQRGYETNLSVIEVSNSLIQKTIEAIGR